MKQLKDARRPNIILVISFYLFYFIYCNMGLIIRCEDKVLHSTYTNYNFMKKNFMDGCKIYMKNTKTPKRKLVYGIYLFLYKSQFSPKNSFVIIQSIFNILKFIHFSKNVYEILCILLHSIYTNKPIFIQ